MPALEMNGHLVKSTTISRTPVTSSCASSSGAVLVSRLPLMMTVRRSVCVSAVICMQGKMLRGGRCNYPASDAPTSTSKLTRSFP